MMQLRSRRERTLQIAPISDTRRSDLRIAILDNLRSAFISPPDKGDLGGWLCIGSV